MTGSPYVFEYAVLRAVPRVERGESINVGVLVWCKQLGYLGARAHLDRDRLLALDAGADVDAVRARARRPSATSSPARVRTRGPPRIDEVGRTFRWLTAPRSTVVQPGPVHTGLTTDPDAEADRLFTAARPARRGR